MMANKQSNGDENFSFGTRELEVTEQANSIRRPSLAIQHSRHGPKRDVGFDPYNSSGSFDRKKNWERIRKR